MKDRNELDDLLKNSMQFDDGKLPEPDPRIQERLRKKLKRKPLPNSNGLLSYLVNFLNLDIKLYHAGIGLAAILIILLVFRNNTETPSKFKQELIVADTNTGSSLKQDSFLVKNFNVSIN
jgi:hypothetical protein